jgi:3-(3-hydroxy-phenyl)propionate hydroxylase
MNNKDSWLLDQLGNDFVGLYFGERELPEETLSALPVRLVRVARASVEDSEGLVAQRYDAQPGTFYLIRPDQHVCARWRQLDPSKVRAALARVTAAEVSHER